MFLVEPFVSSKLYRLILSGDSAVYWCPELGDCSLSVGSISDRARVLFDLDLTGKRCSLELPTSLNLKLADRYRTSQTDGKKKREKSHEPVPSQPI